MAIWNENQEKLEKLNLGIIDVAKSNIQIMQNEDSLTIILPKGHRTVDGNDLCQIGEMKEEILKLRQEILQLKRK